MRIGFLTAVGIIAFAWAAGLSPSSAGDDPVVAAAQAAETALKAKVGLAVIDTGDDRTWFYQADDRFAMASTSKALTCAALLASADTVREAKAKILETDIQEYAPVTKAMIGNTLPVSELCGIALRTSDNTAINKVLEKLGGPSAVTAFLRKIGDETTRLDRNEPTLNEAKPGDPRDTTTPRAISATLQKLVLGQALDRDARNQLTDWLVKNEVGAPLLRAGIPADWRIADRTGAGGFGTRGVIAVMWPPKHSPIVAAVYLTETEASMDQRNAAIASIGKAIANAVLK